MHVSCIYLVGMSRNVMLCTLTFVLAVSLGCIHDEVRSEPGSWIVVGMIPIFDKKKATRTKLRTEDGPQGAARRRIEIAHLSLEALLEDACYKRGVCNRQGEPGSGSPLFYINTWAMVWPNDYPALAT